MAVLLLVLSLGLHWALLQTVAWTGMLVSYSAEGSFQEAVSKTFDGEHPCPLCKAIKKGRAEEKQQEQQSSRPGSKLDAGTLWSAEVFVYPRPPVPIRAPTVLPVPRSEQPPKPRPRAG